MAHKFFELWCTPQWCVQQPFTKQHAISQTGITFTLDGPCHLHCYKELKTRAYMCPSEWLNAVHGNSGFHLVLSWHRILILCSQLWDRHFMMMSLWDSWGSLFHLKCLLLHLHIFVYSVKFLRYSLIIKRTAYLCGSLGPQGITSIWAVHRSM